MMEYDNHDRMDDGLVAVRKFALLSRIQREKVSMTVSLEDEDKTGGKTLCFA